MYLLYDVFSRIGVITKYKNLLLLVTIVIWVVLKLSPLKTLCLMMLSLIRHQMMVLIKKRLLNLRFKLHLPMRGWRHIILGTGSSRRSISQACKVINTKLHWLRLLLP